VSDTPRVDQVHWNHAYLKEEAYKIERELNAANERIKRLEEACRDMVSEEDTYIRLQTWIKAKEAKP